MSSGIKRDGFGCYESFSAYLSSETILCLFLFRFCRTGLKNYTSLQSTCDQIHNSTFTYLQGRLGLDCRLGRTLQPNISMFIIFEILLD